LGILSTCTLFVCILWYIYNRCKRRESDYTDIPATIPTTLLSSTNSNTLLFSAMTPSPHFSAMTPSPSPNVFLHSTSVSPSPNVLLHSTSVSPSPNVLLHSTSDSSSSPTFQSMPALELVTLVDEEEQQPVSSRTRSRKN
jgi:hypothetical protein